MKDTKKKYLQSAILDFADELTDIENLLKLIHLGIINSSCSERDMEDSALKITENYMKSVHDKYVPLILDSLNTLS